MIDRLAEAKQWLGKPRLKLFFSTNSVTTQAENSGRWDALGIAVLEHQVDDSPVF